MNHVAQILASSQLTVIVPLAEILLISHVTGFAYGLVVSHPFPVHVHSVALVVFGVSMMLEISFPLGFVIVTVESVIAVQLSVVGAVKTTFGGKLTVFDELFPAESYTVTVTL